MPQRACQNEAREEKNDAYPIERVPYRETLTRMLWRPTSRTSSGGARCRSRYASTLVHVDSMGGVFRMRTNLSSSDPG